MLSVVEGTLIARE